MRVAYVLGVARYDEKFYDAAYYELQARTIADGHGYVDPFEFLPGAPHRSTPAADHPPLTVFALVPTVKLGDALGLGDESTQLMMRFEIMLVGLGAVALIGLLGRELAGDRVGLVAAGIAAVYPYLWVNDGLIMSEAFATVLVTAALLLLLKLFRRPSLGLALAVGVVCGLGALARAELVLLAPLLGLPLFFSFRKLAWSRRFAIVGSLAVGRGSDGRTVGGVQLQPVRGPDVHLHERRHRDPGLELRPGLLRPVDGVDVARRLHPEAPAPGDQSVASRIYRDRAFDYIKAHKGRAAVVELARIGRDWGLFRPGDMLKWNEAEGRPSWVTGLGMVFYYPILLLAIGGVVVLKRRRIRQWPVLVPPIIVTVGTVLSYGQTRFRVTAEPSLVVLASVAIVALSVRWWPEPDGSVLSPSVPTDQTPESSTIVASSSS